MVNTDYESLFFDHNVYDAWQFVQNTGKMIAYAQYSKDVIVNLIAQISYERDEWQKQLFTTLNEQKQISLKLNDFPDNKVDVAGISVDAQLLLEKLTKDFFQYSRNAFDSIGQIANAALLANKRKKADSTDFPAMQKTFAQKTYSTVFPDMHTWFQTAADALEFQYIDAFNNRTKHTLDVCLKVSMDMFGDGKTTEINPFFRKDVQVDKRDMSSYFMRILDFVANSFDEFLKVVEKECVKDIYNSNRYNQLMVKQQKMNSDPKSDYSVVYIENTVPFPTLPDEIFILLMKKNDDGSIDSRNSPIDNILISDQENHYSGRYVAETTVGDDTMLWYRKYIKDTTVTGMAVFFEELKKTPIFYHQNSYMNITVTSDDKEFLMRCQLPF
jgi:hypothetical protein